VGIDGNGCRGSASKVVTVNPLPSVSLANLGSVCIASGAISLNQGSPSGGIYSGPGISINGFNPVTAGGIGNYTITYTYTNGNGCSNSASGLILVSNFTPAPGAISGQVLGVCPNSYKVYSVGYVAAANSYTWTAPANAIITAGQGTQSVTVSFNSSFVSGALSVIASGACGNSTSSIAVINSKPNTPGQIYGNGNPCRKGMNIYWVKPVAGATSYTWTVPAGTSILSGQGTDSIAVNTGNKSGSITVSASNACGTNGASSALAVNVSCRTTDLTEVNDITMVAYPNPVHDQLNVLFISDTENEYTLKITDMTGRLVTEQLKKADIGDNVVSLNLKLASGIYIVSLTSGELNKQIKVVVE